MRKPWRIALITIGAIVAVPVLALATTSIVNVVATNIEAGEITPYGQKVPVDGKEMNVLVSGTGDETIVLLPGLGTAAPALDFQPLIAELDDTYRVVAVEPFGTGLSDQTDVPRTAENITGEIHEALQQLGIDRYTLMGHSISGIYALTYTAAYQDEVTAFIGIDSSVPDQPGSDEAIPTSVVVTLGNLGITRILSGMAADPYDGLPYDEATKTQMALLTNRNASAPTLVDEMDHTPANFAAVSGATFPASLPLLLFVATEDADVDGWLALHEAQAASVDHGELIELAGGHYLHHTLSAELAQGVQTFLAGIPGR
ncbi:alpha/beta fold hydrolase [Microbacterium oxydans]|uniref:Putative aminoacrylate hydrolase RutD n=1 Tax=Microbacterium oxydans TaxID=82380 RepID=A0A0F0LFR5_9MICO|nr:alpha/beta hydrolase [Microbacterium oxydans]KJL31125.1 putative aminoacrylate hydrolase RutD [Microbacterium oxydans]